MRGTPILSRNFFPFSFFDLQNSCFFLARELTTVSSGVCVNLHGGSRRLATDQFSLPFSSSFFLSLSLFFFVTLFPLTVRSFFFLSYVLNIHWTSWVVNFGT